MAYGRALTKLGIDNKDSLLNTEVMPEQLVEGIATSTIHNNQGIQTKKRKVLDLDNVEFEGEAKGEDEGEDGGKGKGKGRDDENDPEKLDPNDDTISSDPEEEQIDEDATTSDEFELAWEILDIARLIYSDSASIDNRAKATLSDVFCDLGDISMETESFKQAADDFYKAIEIKKELGLEHERDLASTYFKYSIALEYDNQISEAIIPLTRARDLLVLRLDRLVNSEELKGKEKLERNNHLSLSSNHDEADELEHLILDLDSKLEELTSQVKNGIPGKMDINELKVTMSSAAQDAVKDLSGLVRKRGSAPIEEQ